MIIRRIYSLSLIGELRMAKHQKIFKGQSSTSVSQIRTLPYHSTGMPSTLPNEKTIPRTSSCHTLPYSLQVRVHSANRDYRDTASSSPVELVTRNYPNPMKGLPTRTTYEGSLGLCSLVHYVEQSLLSEIVLVSTTSSENQ